MKIATRRRLALGVVATTSALVAGVLIAPSSNAAADGVEIVPNGASNTDASEVLTFKTTDADLRYGGSAVFTRVGGGRSFTVTIPGPTLPGASPDREERATVDFTDVGDGVGGDGPADAGTYTVSVTGDTMSPLPGGGGNDTCTTACFTVLAAGPVAVTSVAPTAIRPGAQKNVSVLGENFERGSRIDVLFPNGEVDGGVSANNPPTADDTNTGRPIEDNITTRTELKRRFVVAAGTEPGERDVQVTNFLEDGSTATALCKGCFFVSGPALTSISRTSDFNDPDQALTTITFNSTNGLVDGKPRLDFIGDPGSASRTDLRIEGQNVRDYTGTSITADFDLRNAAPANNGYQPTVEDENGVVNACDGGQCLFTVQQRDTRKPPTLTTFDRSTLAGTQNRIRQGEVATFAVTGEFFSKGARILFPGTTGNGLTVTKVEFVSPGELSVEITAAPDAPVGEKDPQVQLTDKEDNSTSAPCDNCLVVEQGSGASPSPSASASPAPGNGSFDFERFAGDDRYTTAARIATGSFAPGQTETALLANGQSDDPRTPRDEDHFPDALAGAYLAGNRDAPTLLTTETTTPEATKDALRTLGTRNIVILGGTSAVSAKQEEDLRRAGFEVTRLGGSNRYETAKRIAETPALPIGENENGDLTAVVASGEGFADALVAGPLGYAARFPLLITARAGLSEPTRQALKNLEVEHVIIPGGTAAVSQQVEDDIQELGITTRRFAGSSRTETATLVADYAYDALGFDRSHVDLARGDRFPDALAGGPHAGVSRSPVLLTATPNDIGAVTEDFLRRRGAALREGDIFGGFAAVSQSAEDQAERAIREGTAGSSPSPSSSASPTGSASPSPSVSPTASASPTTPVSPSPSTSASP